jgi:hypothetical protein
VAFRSLRLPSCPPPHSPSSSRICIGITHASHPLTSSHSYTTGSDVERHVHHHPPSAVFLVTISKKLAFVLYMLFFHPFLFPFGAFIQYGHLPLITIIAQGLSSLSHTHHQRHNSTTLSTYERHAVSNHSFHITTTHHLGYSLPFLLAKTPLFPFFPFSSHSS